MQKRLFCCTHRMHFRKKSKLFLEFVCIWENTKCHDITREIYLETDFKDHVKTRDIMKRILLLCYNNLPITSTR